MLSKSSIIAFCANLKLINDSNLLNLLKSLENSDYIDIVYSIKNDTQLYCITLHPKGKNFKAESKMAIQNIKNRVLITILCACISYIVGRVLIAIFS